MTAVFACTTRTFQIYIMQLIKILPRFFFCFSVFFPLAGLAQQAPYVGGEADGYDMAVWRAGLGWEEDFQQQLILAPSSVTSGDFFQLQSSRVIDRAEVHLLDIHGKMIFRKDWIAGKAVSLLLPSLPAGFYFLHIKTENKMAVKKLQVLGE